MLPPEIRKLIWKQFFVPRKIIHTGIVTFTPKSQSLTDMRLVNWESNQVFLENYHQSSFVHKYINCDLDTLAFVNGLPTLRDMTIQDPITISKIKRIQLASRHQEQL